MPGLSVSWTLVENGLTLKLTIEWVESMARSWKTFSIKPGR